MIMFHKEIKAEFPELFTKKGALIKREPKKYACDCGHSFSQTKTFRVGGIGFGSKTCSKCGNRAKDSVSYNIWKRMINHQIMQEDFILNTVQDKGVIQKEKLEELLAKEFEFKTDALGALVYFGYLNVDAEKRDKSGVIEYRINVKKDLKKRYEYIR